MNIPWKAKLVPMVLVPGLVVAAAVVAQQPPPADEPPDAKAPVDPEAKRILGLAPRGFGPAVLGAHQFLNALKARDPEALAEAVALRAPTEAEAPEHQKLFQSILDKNLSDEDLTTLCDQFEGYHLFNVINGPSTGRILVIIDKSTKKDEFQKTLTMRKEKAGWKVVDFSGRRSFMGKKSRFRGNLGRIGK